MFQPSANSHNNINNANNYSCINITPTPNPSAADHPNQSNAQWKKVNCRIIVGTLIVGYSMIAGLREAKLSWNRKVKVLFLSDANTEDLLFHLIPYLIT